MNHLESVTWAGFCLLPCILVLLKGPIWCLSLNLSDFFFDFLSIFKYHRVLFLQLFSFPSDLCMIHIRQWLWMQWLVNIITIPINYCLWLLWCSLVLLLAHRFPFFSLLDWLLLSCVSLWHELLADVLIDISYQSLLHWGCLSILN